MIYKNSKKISLHSKLSITGEVETVKKLIRGVLIAIVIVCLPISVFAEEKQQVAAESEETSSGLPLPRFASLKSDNVFVRTGPSMDYPIKWIYKKDGLPVEIIQEFDSWRKIKDSNGDIGWAHKILLTGKKMAQIMSQDAAIAYNNTEMERPVVKFENGVVVSVEECQKLMCRVHFAPYEGWIEKKHLWGVYGSDIFN
jgi:SH3-like domain-containing protein